jgi:tetratricopeptide (TPR) repeat protein
LQAGFPAEAKKIIDQGFASSALGTGTDAERQKRLRDLATKQASDDRKTLAQNETEAGNAKDGTALINVGYAYVTYGDFDKGLKLMEQGLQKGSVRRPDDATLHLGEAYLLAGQKAKAVQTFKTVQGNDGTADLARLWILHAGR